MNTVPIRFRDLKGTPGLDEFIAGGTYSAHNVLQPVGRTESSWVAWIEGKISEGSKAYERLDIQRLYSSPSISVKPWETVRVGTFDWANLYTEERIAEREKKLGRDLAQRERIKRISIEVRSDPIEGRNS